MNRGNGPAIASPHPHECAGAAATAGSVTESMPGGLVHVSDTQPGIRRRRAGKGFMYLDADGTPVRDPNTLARIRQLAIPPAWKGVWICPEPHGHIQATGRDAQGRKQYRYHPEWAAHRNAVKFESLMTFAECLPRLRQRVSRDLRRPPLERRRMAAAAVRLLDATHIRVGNRAYTRTSGARGLTTLSREHVHVDGACIELHYTAKGGRERRIRTCDAALSKLVRGCRDLPGQELFRYQDESGALVALGSADVNDYIRQAAGGPFSAKDFRTWAGSVTALQALSREASQGRYSARALNTAVDEVAGVLGNTKAVCRKYYIHPALTEAFRGQRLQNLLAQCDSAAGPKGLRREERLLHAFLKKAAQQGVA